VTELTAVCSLSLFCATPFSSPPRILPSDFQSKQLHVLGQRTGNGGLRVLLLVQVGRL
jgi:hypothetical protein